MERVDYESVSIQDIINWYKHEELDLQPWYQRRSVWKRPQMSYLINTLFGGKPVPTCYIRHYLDMQSEKSIKEVVDGQQRIRTILSYAADEYAARHPRHQRLVKYSELTEAEKAAFKMTKVSVGYLIGADDSDVIDIFGRLNSVSKTLNSQEKRNAKYSGEFKQFCLEQAAVRVNFWRSANIFSANDISRMVEVQFVAELAQNLIKGLVDYSSAKLDRIFEEYDEEFVGRAGVERRIEKVFEKIEQLGVEPIRETIFSRAPLFFSLFIVLDRHGSKISKAGLKEGVYRIDSVFNSSVHSKRGNKADTEFFLACTSSTQRIKSRQVRNDYIASELTK